MGWYVSTRRYLGMGWHVWYASSDFDPIERVTKAPPRNGRNAAATHASQPRRVAAAGRPVASFPRRRRVASRSARLGLLQERHEFFLAGRVMRALFRPAPPVLARLRVLWERNGLTLRLRRLGFGDADGAADEPAGVGDERVVGIQVRV